MCMKRGQGRRLLLIAGFPQLAEYTGLVYGSSDGDMLAALVEQN